MFLPLLDHENNENGCYISVSNTLFQRLTNFKITTTSSEKTVSTENRVRSKYNNESYTRTGFCVINSGTADKQKLSRIVLTIKTQLLIQQMTTTTTLVF